MSIWHSAPHLPLSEDKERRSIDLTCEGCDKTAIITYKRLHNDLNGTLSEICASFGKNAPKEIEELALLFVDFMAEVETLPEFEGWRDKLIIDKEKDTVTVGNVTLSRQDISEYFDASIALFCDNVDESRFSSEKFGLARLLKEYLKG